MNALSVHVSVVCIYEYYKSQTIRRPWYSNQSDEVGIDPRPRHTRDRVLKAEKAAVTCRYPMTLSLTHTFIRTPILYRASSSFLRVGHVQLYGRRVVRDRSEGNEEMVLWLSLEIS